MEENPGVKFGEISRIVAERWRQMTDADKQVERYSKTIFSLFLKPTYSGLC